MNPEENQVENAQLDPTQMSPEMTPDEAMAALAISTRMSEQMMEQEAQMQQGMGEDTPVEGEITPKTASGGTETPDTANITDEITKGLKEAKTELKTELRDMIKSELKKLMDDDEDNKETNE